MKVLAQFDIVKPRFPANDVRMSGFYSSTDYINTLAEKHPGFIWRETKEDTQRLFDLWGEGYLYTISLWKSPDYLKHFLYETPHVDFMKRGREWFVRLSKPTTVLWWVEENHTPTLEEAHQRLTQLTKYGPSYTAFDLSTCNLPITAY